MLTRQLYAMALVTSTLMVTTAFAAQDYIPTQTVHVADLDLSTPAGVKKLRHRVAMAVYDVCGDDHGIMTVGERQIIRSCVDKAKASAEPQIAALTPKRIQTASSR